MSVVSIWECVIKYQIGKLNFPESPEIYLPKKRQQYAIESLVVDEDSIRYKVRSFIKIIGSNYGSSIHSMQNY